VVQQEVHLVRNELPESVRCLLLASNVGRIEALLVESSPEVNTLQVIVDLARDIDLLKADASICAEPFPPGVRLRTNVRVPGRLVLEATVAQARPLGALVARVVAHVAERVELR